jgi:hypothetical protein
MVQMDSSFVENKKRYDMFFIPRHIWNFLNSSSNCCNLIFEDVLNKFQNCFGIVFCMEKSWLTQWFERIQVSMRIERDIIRYSFVNESGIFLRENYSLAPQITTRFAYSPTNCQHSNSNPPNYQWLWKWPLRHFFPSKWMKNPSHDVHVIF